MLHFGRRGRENLTTLTRKDFAVKQGDGGLLYVYKTTDEKTKNHQDDSMKSSDGRMYEIKGKKRIITLSLNNNAGRQLQYLPIIVRLYYKF
jgi:hypothetical protein